MVWWRSIHYKPWRISITNILHDSTLVINYLYKYFTRIAFCILRVSYTLQSTVYSYTVITRMIIRVIILCFRNGVLPIAMGAPPEDYAAVAPPHSFLHVDWFASPKALADYLLYLDRNHSAYNEYFAWRREPGFFLDDHRTTITPPRWATEPMMVHCSGHLIYSQAKEKRNNHWD